MAILVIDFRPGETAVGPQGPAGFQGIQGTPGSDILSGYTAPSPMLGIDLDMYINNTTGELFKKIAGIWVFQTSLIGPSFSVGNIDGGMPNSIYGGTFAVFGGIP
jgi:hypothetical protein